MAYFYSPHTQGFYVDTVHKVMPEDVFEVPDEQYKLLMEGQTLGRSIAYKGRKLQLVERKAAVPTWELVRGKRDMLLTRCDWTQIPDAQLTAEQRTAWQTYRQALRDLTKNFSTPGDVVWPNSPDENEE